jgi:hypothetical protein
MDTETLILQSALVRFNAIFALIVGLLVLSGNPYRFTNQVFTAATALFTVMMICIHKAIAAGLQYDVDHLTLPGRWLKAAAACSVFVPWLLVMLRESMHTANGPSSNIVRRSLPWFVLGLAMAGLAATDWYIPRDSRPGDHKFGPAYTFNNITLLIIYSYFILHTWLQTQKHRGIRRIEMQFLALNIGVSAFAGLTLAIAANLFGVYLLKQISVLAVPFALGVTAWAIFFYRIYNYCPNF